MRKRKNSMEFMNSLIIKVLNLIIFLSKLAKLSYVLINNNLI